MKLNLPYFNPIFVLTLFFIFSGLVFSQPAEIPSHIQPYTLESGYFDGSGAIGEAAVKVFSGSVTVPDIPWIQLKFSESELGEGSYVIIKSMFDNHWQKLNAVSIKQWNYFSAFFNGGEIEIDLFVAPQDKQIYFKIVEVVAGDWADLQSPESQCGPTDDRTLSNHPATGRLLNVGCTAWIIPNGKLVSAGHCLSGSSATILQFQVPLSLPNGTLQHPGPEDQYSVNVATKIFVNGGVGNDWGTFEVFPNSVTGLMPKVAQAAYWPLVQDLGPASIRITGYGVDGGVNNQVQQTHLGPNAGSSGTTMRYQTDTEGGNSGSPVIDEATQKAVGVHTHGGCTTSGTGNNSGTSLFSAAFWAAVDMGAGGCDVEVATGPNPANNSTNISINLAQLSWTNGAGAITNELYFGTNPNTLTLVQSGSLATSWNITSGPLEYSTSYYWRVDEIGDSCMSQGSVWAFITEDDPGNEIDELYCTDFTAGIGDFTITNEGGTCVWQQLTTTSNTYTLPPTAAGNVLGADSDLCGSGTTLLSTARLNTILNLTAQNYHYAEIKFDNDWRIIDAADEAHVEVSTNGGTTWTSVWSKVGVDQRNSTEIIDITSLVGQANVLVRFRTVQPGWDWWWIIDNLCISAHYIIPVEMTSFTAAVAGTNVELNWATATETNNQGFHIQRSNGGEFTSVGFVAGHGTTTETQSYSFVDRNVQTGSYSYRLKQVDFDGTFEYSDVIETEIVAPAEFTLDQNYPNPFNPSTKISFKLAADSKVSLKVFDVLGQEVLTLVNNELTAGSHSVDFDASGLNSGVYFYKLEASGNNGVQFSDVKKMILTK